MHKGIVSVVWMAIATIFSHPILAQKARDRPPFVLMENRDAPGTVEPEKLDECLRFTLREMNLEDRELPFILVYHVSRETADELGLETNSIWMANVGGHPRYELWIVGRPSNFLYNYMLEKVLEKHFQVTVDAVQRSRIVAKVEHSLDVTVDARSFR